MKYFALLMVLTNATFFPKIAAQKKLLQTSDPKIKGKMTLELVANKNMVFPIELKVWF